MKSRNPHIKKIGLILISIIVVILVSCSASLNTESEPAAPEPTEVPTSANPDEPQFLPTQTPAPDSAILYERRLISLDWPEKIRVGDSERITLIIQVDQDGKITPTVSSEEHTLDLEPVFIPDIYEDHYLNLEARIDIAGMEVLPQGIVSTAIIKGKDVKFAWSLSPRQVGKFSGTVWLYLNIIPKEAGHNQKELLMAKPIDIQGVTVFGMPANVARLSGAFGTGISFLLGLPFFESILSWLFGKIKKRPIIKTNKV